jgi:hypothetical protein
VLTHLSLASHSGVKLGISVPVDNILSQQPLSTFYSVIVILATMARRERGSARDSASPPVRNEYGPNATIIHSFNDIPAEALPGPVKQNASVSRMGAVRMCGRGRLLTKQQTLAERQCEVCMQQYRTKNDLDIVNMLYHKIVTADAAKIWVNEKMKTLHNNQQFLRDMLSKARKRRSKPLAKEKPYKERPGA